MQDLNPTNFEQQTARGTVVVDFSAEWCAPCRALAPILKQAEAGMAGGAGFGVVDAEDDANRPLLLRFGIEALPTVIIFKDGQPARVIRGFGSEKSFLAQLRDAVNGENGSDAR